jgi:hypothetical protein
MKSRELFASLLIGTIGIPALNAQELSSQSKSNNASNTKRQGEEKLETLLTDLLSDCKKLLTKQVAVHNGIRPLQQAIEANDGKQPRPADKQAALKLAYQMQDIVNETTRLGERLEAEGTAVAFPEVFNQLRDDMRRLQWRLENCDLGRDAQSLEEDVLDTLKEIVGAFTKAR